MMTLNEQELIFPQWPAPPNVRALQTTRQGGGSAGPYHSFNLGDHVGDAPLTVAANRRLLQHHVPSEPVWLRQVHGTHIVDAARLHACPPTADAAYSRALNTVCAVMTADCLPVLLCDATGTVVAVAHAGWRGLAAGVLEATVHAMRVPPTQLLAWLGPAIGRDAFEVGQDVHAAFTAHDAAAAAAFRPAAGNKWLADIELLARQRLNSLGVSQVYGGGFCTFSDRQRFFSFRRDGVSGRMATLIWLAGQ